MPSRSGDVASRTEVAAPCSGVFWSGLALAAVGEREAAVADLQRAEEALWECSAARDADAAARELRRLGERVMRRPRADQRRCSTCFTREPSRSFGHEQAVVPLLVR